MRWGWGLTRTPKGVIFRVSASPNSMATFRIHKTGRGWLEILIDDEDLELVSTYQWHVDHSGYVQTTTGQGRRHTGTSRYLKLHHLILGRQDGFVVDHVNGDKLDNRRSNLRFVTQADNARNQHIQLRGIYKKRNRWLVRLQFKGQRHYGGSHDSLQAAIECRDKLARLLYGDIYHP